LMRGMYGTGVQILALGLGIYMPYLLKASLSTLYKITQESMS